MANNIGYLSGAMHYAFIFENTKDKFDRYSMVMTLEGDQVGAARNMGLKINQNPEKFNGLPYVSLKSSFPPKLLNADKTDYSGPTRLAFGSKCVAKISQRPYDNKFGKGITTFLSAVMITDPVEYVPEGQKDNNDFADAPAPSSKSSSAAALTSSASKGKKQAASSGIGF